MKVAEVRRWWMQGRRPWVLVFAPTLGVIAELESQPVLAVAVFAIPVLITSLALAIGGKCARCGLNPRPCDACRARVVEDY